MREILFRGLHRRKGEKVRLDGLPVESAWVYGGYCQYNEERGIIYQTTPDIHKYPVYAETVGQFTGHTDKNNKRVFESDILKARLDELYPDNVTTVVIKWIDSGFYAVQAGREPDPLEDFPFELFEVVGNIYDNPELLEG